MQIFWLYENEIFIVWQAFFSINKIIKLHIETFFKEKQTRKKFRIFDQNHGLTPIKNAFFWLSKYEIFIV